MKDKPGKGKLTPEELRLWQSQLKGVTPLSKRAETPKELPAPKKVAPPKLRPLEIKRAAPPEPLPLQDFGRKQLRHVKVDARLDLHGLSLEKGYDALEQFLMGAQARGFKVVLVITGKGPISSENTLRHLLPRWVEERPVRHLISGFHAPARPQDGGQGACYIVVKKG